MQTISLDCEALVRPWRFEAADPVSINYISVKARKERRVAGTHDGIHGRWNIHLVDAHFEVHEFLEL